MKEDIIEEWFIWFYKHWENFSPGDLIDQGVIPSQIAERFIYEKEKDLLKFAKKIDENRYDALNQFMKLSESELLVIKYFLKLIKLK